MESPSPSQPAGRSTTRWVAIAVAVALVAAVAALVLARDEDGDRAPARWDRRIAELAAFVEEERGLEFRHPVETRFLGDARFRAAVTDEEELTAEEEADLEHYEGVLRALGLASGELDLRAAANQLAGEGVLGIYLPEDDRILLRGRTVSPAMRPTIVHELTHALQAQHFDLDLDRDTSGEDLAFRALVEADAGRIEQAYLASLPAEERAEVVAAQRSQAQAVDIEGVPPILTELFAMPYAFGPPFVLALEEEGEDAVDQAFVDPPTSEEHLLDPSSFLEDDLPVDVEPPRLRDGEEQADEPNDFGMLSMLLVLGERLPFGPAWTAVDGWAGDASITFRADGRDCIRIRTIVDTDADADELEAASQDWVGDRTTAEVRRAGRSVVLTSCDPGTDAAPAPPERPRTFDLVQLRSELIASLTATAVPEPVAACATDRILRDEDPATLLAIATIEDPQDPRIVDIQRRVVAALESCAGG